MPSILHHILNRDDELFAADKVADELAMDVIKEFTWFCVNGGLSIFLVLLGGLFAGLTIALMGQDKVTLQVLALSGRPDEKKNAEKVLNLLKHGKHWILVTLLLGNVITNETLPIVLDHDLGGGWLAICMSSLLIVVFGEIIPQSICAKYGLAIGARSSTLVLWLMYTLSPVGYPTAKLLDFLLGEYHGTTFTRAGLKTLIMLHEITLASPLTERLHQGEVSALCSFLDMHDKTVSAVMTPFARVFSLSTEARLDERTRYAILQSGHGVVPVYLGDGNGAGGGGGGAVNRGGAAAEKMFVGCLKVQSLVALDSRQEVAIGELELKPLTVVGPETSCQEIVALMGNRRSTMVLVTEGGRNDGRALGICTYRDVMEELTGGEMC